MTRPKAPIRAINETGDTSIDVQLIQVPDSAITAGSNTISIASLTGDVTGPASATDNAIVRFDATTGKVIQNSATTVADTTGSITTAATGFVVSGNVSGGFATTATAATTTTLVVTDKQTQEFTGSTTQTVKLPVVSTLPQIGFAFRIINNSTGVVTVQSSGANTIQAMAAGSSAWFIANALTGTGASVWTVIYAPLNIQSFVVPCGDRTTAITATTNVMSFRMPYAFKLTGIRASLVTAQASGNIFTVDVNEAGTSILSTKLTIDNTENSSTTAATPPVISDADLADDALISVDVDQIGNGSAAGLIVTLIGYQP